MIHRIRRICRIGGFHDIIDGLVFIHDCSDRPPVDSVESVESVDFMMSMTF